MSESSGPRSSSQPPVRPDPTSSGGKRPPESTYGLPTHQDGIQSGNLSNQPAFPPGGRVDIGRPGDEASEGTPGTGEKPCPRCGGSGRVGESICAMCEGQGTVIGAIGGG